MTVGLLHLDLFSGIGGFALAAQWAGFETVAFCEIEPYCQKVLRKNFGQGIVIHDDIRKLDGKQYAGTIDLLTGGFPCQPFSIAGKRRGNADDRSLWHEMFRIVQECKPAWVVGENVAHFVNMELDNVRADLESEGYEVQPFVIPAASVGAPHKRDRVFVVAYAQHRRPQNGWGSGIGTNVHAQDENKRPAVAKLCRRPDVPDAQCARPSRSGRRDEPEGAKRSTLNISSKDVSDALDNGPYRTQRYAPESGSYKQNDGIPFGNIQWAVEPGMGRVANGVSHRVDRLRGLGNAVVPQQVYPILKGIAEAQLQQVKP